MCGIVGGITFNNIGEILLEGLKRLEYRGYDSAGLAILDENNQLVCEKVKGKVKELCALFATQPVNGCCGLAHTRWATHGIPSQNNAHPHVSHGEVAIVHNGIIENYETMKVALIEKGYKFITDTDSEVIAHLTHSYLKETNNLVAAVQLTTRELQGMYAIGVISTNEPNCIIAARSGSPLVVGLGENENYIASDSLTLLPLTHQFIYLEEGDVAKITQTDVTIYNHLNERVERQVITSVMSDNAMGRGHFRHFMEKEIFEQPQSCAAAIEGRISHHKIPAENFGINAPQIFPNVENILLVACGTSYHAALVARYWFEEIAGVACGVEIASEYRYRHPVIKKNTLFVALSQSGETADTLASFRQAKKQGYLATLAICNVPDSTLVRESELVFLTHAGPEIGVASTKSFTSQLVSLLMLTAVIGEQRLLKKNKLPIIDELSKLPDLIDSFLCIIKDEMEDLAKSFIDKQNALFLGRGSLYPIAMEGALKLKEITYIHAEAYPAGELKHGPLALVDRNMPVIVVAPSDKLFEKLLSNLQEVRARGGNLIVFAEDDQRLQKELHIRIIKMPVIPWFVAPILYVIPLQLLAYYVGILKGTDIDQPRNLAKSVTVE